MKGKELVVDPIGDKREDSISKEEDVHDVNKWIAKKFHTTNEDSIGDRILIGNSIAKCLGLGVVHKPPRPIGVEGLASGMKGQ